MSLSSNTLFPALGQAGPASVNAGASVSTGGTYLKLPAGCFKLRVIAEVGTVGSSPTHALSANQATSSGGANTKAVAGISGTFGTVANTVVQFDFDLTQVLDINGGFNFIQLVATNNSGSASIVALQAQTDVGAYA